MTTYLGRQKDASCGFLIGVICTWTLVDFISTHIWDMRAEWEAIGNLTQFSGWLGIP